MSSTAFPFGSAGSEHFESRKGAPDHVYCPGERQAHTKKTSSPRGSGPSQKRPPEANFWAQLCSFSATHAHASDGQTHTHTHTRTHTTQHTRTHTHNHTDTDTNTDTDTDTNTHTHTHTEQPPLSCSTRLRSDPIAPDLPADRTRPDPTAPDRTRQDPTGPHPNAKTSEGGRLTRSPCVDRGGPSTSA